MTCPYGTGVPYTGGQCPKDHGCDECEHWDTSRLEPARGMASMQLFMCGSCGAFITGYLDATDKYAPRYCPNCGKRLTI